ncbi:lambda family phage portal protein [Agrobacterium vitis]|nr:lambda family phage portal protein [Agrobacterium vitis]MBE1437069.1 lambda family phage portal protein [Agrobacterium vitis]
MNLLDKAVSFFSPESGVRRASARQMLDSIEKRDYAAAGNGRRNKNWRARSTTATMEVAGAMTTLRNRAREFVRNSWAGPRILDVMTSHVIGTGIMTVPDTGSDRADRLYRLAREEWEASSDIEGVLDYGGQQALLFRSMIEGGDCILRMLPISMAEAVRTVPLRLLGLEGDQIDVSRDSVYGTNTTSENVRLGIKLGEWGQRRGCYLSQYHPGDTGSWNVTQSALVDWADLCHLYRPLRLGQIRGISHFAPILLSGQEIQDLMEAAIVQQRTQASLTGFIKRPPGVANPLITKPDDKSKERITSIRPGQIQDIGEAEITFPNPSSTSVFAEAYNAGLYAMAAGAGITYDQMTGDLRQANFSSLRAGKIEFRRLVEQLQWHCFVPLVCRKVDRRFEDYATMAGVLSARRGGYPVNHVMPAVEPIDPKKDMEADILAVRSGRMSPQEFISSWGRDWRKVAKDFEAFFAFTDAHNITLDIDPRKPANGAAVGQQPQLGDNGDE